VQAGHQRERDRKRERVDEFMRDMKGCQGTGQQRGERGSASAPSPSEARVMPNWQAEIIKGSCSIARKAVRALRELRSSGSAGRGGSQGPRILPRRRIHLPR
jgi:hypothetical protein